jgi:hypothetical protein
MVPDMRLLGALKTLIDIDEIESMAELIITKMETLAAGLEPVRGCRIGGG